jgi:hypothetical protein
LDFKTRIKYYCNILMYRIAIALVFVICRTVPAIMGLPHPTPATRDF